MALVADAVGNAGQICCGRRKTMAFSRDFQTQIAQRTERDATAGNRCAIDPSRRLDSEAVQDAAISKREQPNGH
jgi:hypothetical protein